MGGLVLAVVPLTVQAAPAVSTVFNFTVAGGFEPYAKLILNPTTLALYGVAYGGGKASATTPSPSGTVFELTPAAHGLFKEKLLYTFKGGVDGSAPSGALLSDATGALYGTTSQGGNANNGTVFKLVPPAKGNTWKKQILHTFSGPDGSQPFAGLTADASGNLYGVTTGGGLNGQGTVFELQYNAGKYSESTIYDFVGPEGSSPHGVLSIDLNTGILYGTTTSDTGPNYAGSIFSLAPPASAGGTWVFTELHAFTGGADGGSPQGGMARDTAGNLYGTSFGTGSGLGTVFEISPSAGGPTYNYQVLYSFTGTGLGYPFGDLLLTTAGQLAGTLIYSNDTNDSGAVFILSPPHAGAGWTPSFTYQFNGLSGAYSPYAGLTAAPGGLLYGVGLNGGTHDEGAVFKVTP